MRRRRLIVGAVLFFFSFLIIAFVVPLPSIFEAPTVSSLRVLDRNGVALYDQRTAGLQREATLQSIPPAAIDALLATEDRTFWTNPGLSLRGILRALWHDINAGRIVEGGSTITQQYVRSMVKPRSRGVLYKMYEAWLAVKLTSRVSKQEILERFLNTAYFGQQAYGFSAAAEIYFGKDVSELSLAENALLIGLLNAPSSLNPFKDVQGAVERRHLVLQRLLTTGSIDESELQEALSEPVTLTTRHISIVAPHFVMWQLGLRRHEWSGKTEVRTTLDATLQFQTEEIIRYQLEKLKDLNVSSAAVVVLDAKTGDVLSMVGSADYFDEMHDGNVNVALSPRQPGSSIKPFSYALAFLQGLTPATTVADVESKYTTQEGTPYTPRNYDFGYHGLVRLREALGNSYNIASIKVLERVGVPELVSFLRRLKLTTISESPEHYGLALTLGDAEVSLLELTRAYAIFPRGGLSLTLRTAMDDPIVKGEQILPEGPAWLVTDILSDNDARAAEFGRTSPLAFSFPVAAKTGTTRNSRDNWTIGFTKNRIVGVWVGNADNSPMRGTSGITGAAPIFHDVMLAAMHGVPKEAFHRPSDIVDRTICRLSGKLVTELCPSSLTEHFMTGTEPIVSDDIYKKVLIDSRNGLLATPSCDIAFVRSDVFAFFPPEVVQWSRDNGWKQPPTLFSPLCGETVRSSVSSRENSFFRMTSPSNGTEYTLDPLIPDTSEMIALEASADPSILQAQWSVDGTPVGTGVSPEFRLMWKPTIGKHRIQIQAGQLHDSVSIEVLQ